MSETMYQLLWMFAIYSFFGWAFGTAFAAVRTKKFIDVGFLYGPYCPSYGFSAIIFTIFLSELKGNLFFLFLGGAILYFVMIFFTGFFLEKIFHQKWWDYSERRYHFSGYVNLPYTALWGILAILVIQVLNPFLKDVLVWIPDAIGGVLLLIIGMIAAIDFVGTITGILTVKSHIRKLSVVYQVSENLQKTADMMGEGVTRWVLRHLEKAYPRLNVRSILEAKLVRQKRREEEEAGIFAVGCGFYKLICIFFLGAFLGDIVETIFCYLKYGEIMSRSSVIYGDFSIVWGFGCVLLTVILYQYRDRSDRFIFIYGTLLGGAYEYICSVLSEMVFGTVFWDYSNIPFNLGGRINLLYCFFWGFAAVIWMKGLYPFFSKWIEKIPKKAGVLITWIFVVFMIFDLALSGLAMMRFSVRQTEKKEAGNQIERYLDNHFPDERIKQIYPHVKIVD